MTGFITDVEGRHRVALNAFIVRSMRVDAHSLAGDRAALHRLEQMPFTVQVDPATGTAALIQEFPPEEQIESAAARVRPLILNGDPTFHAKFFNAAGFFLHRAQAPDEPVQQLNELKKAWARIHPAGTHVRGYYIERSTADSPDWQRATDNELGFAWIYGDVVHNDVDRLARTASFGVEERFRAAVPLVAHIMVLTIATLNFARQLHQDGLLPLQDGIFDTPVVVTELTVRREGRVYVGEPAVAGEPKVLPPVGQGFGEFWTPIHHALFPPSTIAGSDADDTSHLHVEMLDSAGTVLASVDLDRIERTQDADGVRVVLQEVNRVFQVQDQYDPAAGTVTRTIRLTDLTGQPVSAASPALRFLAVCHTPNVGRVSLRGTPPEHGGTDPAWTLEPLDDFRGGLAVLNAAVEALTVIEQYISTEIRFPDSRTTDTKDIGRWCHVAQLLRGEEITATYPEGQHLLVAYDDGSEPPDHGTIAVKVPLTVAVGNQHLDLGTSAAWLSDATLVGHQVHEGRTLYAFTTPDRQYRCRLADDETRSVNDRRAPDPAELP